MRLCVRTPDSVYYVTCRPKTAMRKLFTSGKGDKVAHDSGTLRPLAIEAELQKLPRTRIREDVMCSEPPVRNRGTCLIDERAKKDRSTINFETVRKIGLALPDVEESTAFGAPALKVRGKLLACLPTHGSAEPGSLIIRVGFDDRTELLAAAPDVYYVTDHYVGYSAVLVRMSRVTSDVLRDLLGMAHKFVNSHEAARRSPTRNKRKRI
jgi:hypothetical protein